MISHALTIVINELNTHLNDHYHAETNTETHQVDLGNLTNGVTSTTGSGSIQRDKIYLSVVNIQEEKTLKNLPHRIPDTASLKTTYENSPVFINMLILVTATHTEYANALTGVSRTIRFFQSNNVFTQENVRPESLTRSSPPINKLDQLESFKFIFDLYSPSLEEVNHLWGTLGGKQYPFVLYKLRMLDLQFKAVQGEGGLVEEVVTNFSHKTE
ncbi:MAG: DUF4255 domain-containing protein [Candidatus Electrothrix sp. AW2]|nr:DUF4255 domain-containing protein [Candidatus Electrothrix gigas]